MDRVTHLTLDEIAKRGIGLHHARRGLSQNLLDSECQFRLQRISPQITAGHTHQLNLSLPNESCFLIQNHSDAHHATQSQRTTLR